VNFGQSTYTIDEDKGPVQVMLILSSLSTTDITVIVYSNDGSATGENLKSFITEFLSNMKNNTIIIVT